MASDFQFHHVKEAGRVHFFCPLCRHHQSTNTIRKVGFKNIAQLLVLTAATTFVSWPIFGAKGAALFFVYWAGFEIFYRLRKRQALVCESCGFDPFLYKQDVKKARANLKQHWEKRIQTENLFAGKKLKNYQTGPVKQQATQAVTDGVNLSAEKKDGGNTAGASTS